MAASIIRQEPSQISSQAKIDLLLVGDVTVQYLSDIVQKLFSNIAKVTITISDVRKAAALLNECTFNMVFLKMSLPTAKELEAVKLIRFGRKKNIHLLFVFIISEKFKGCLSGYGADITLIEPLTMEKLSIVVKYWKTYFSNTVKNESSMKPEQSGFPRRSPVVNSWDVFLPIYFLGLQTMDILSEDMGDDDGSFESSLPEFVEHDNPLFVEMWPFTILNKEETWQPINVVKPKMPSLNSESLRKDIGLELKVSFSDFETSKKISVLHSSKEKLRRERIKHCCEQLRTLVPSIKGRKNDAASILEATVDYVKYILKKIPPAAMGQITEVLQSNRRFCKKQQMPIQLSLPGIIMAQRENSVLASTHSPLRGISFLTSQSSSTSENAIGDVYKTQVPGTALFLNSFHAVNYYSTVIPSYDAVAVTNQNISVHFPSAVPKVSKFLPQQCNSVRGQTCTTHPNCLQQFWDYQ